MKIISEHRDFYDTAQAWGNDDSLVYERIEKRLEMYPFGGFFSHPVGGRNPTLSVKSFVVGFCGKTYYGVEINLFSQPPGERKFCYSLADVDSWVESHFPPKKVAFYKEKDASRKSTWNYYQRRKDFETYFKPRNPENTGWAVGGKRLQEFFLKHHTPVFVAYSEKTGMGYTLINGKLKDVEFFRVFDPYTAFQEITMFMSNLAVPLKPIPEISDEDMVSIKGFDKFSFRKDPKK